MVMGFKHVPLWPSNILLLCNLLRHAFLKNPRVHALWLQPDPLQAQQGVALGLLNVICFLSFD